MITVKESRLEDSSRKSAHHHKTGYDYNKEVQKHIQALVEIEIENFVATPRRRTIKVLLPAIGLYNEKVLIKEEDIIAYSESHPQCAASPSMRREIIEKLKLGVSHQEQVIQNSKKKEQQNPVRIRLVDSNTNSVIREQSFISRNEYTKWLTETVVSQGSILSNSKSSSLEFDYDIVVGTSFIEPVNQPEIDSLSNRDASLLTFSIDSIYPSPPSTMTHKTLRSTFARSGFKSSDIIGNISELSKVRILQGYTHDGAWAIADSEEYPEYGLFFILRSDIELLPEILEHPKKLTEEKSLPSPQSVPVDWTLQDYDTPFYDSSDAKYKVNVLTSHDSFEESTQTILAEAFDKGAKILLSNLGKKSTRTKIQSIRESEYYNTAIRTSDIYVSDRPRAYISVLVEAPYMDIITLEDSADRTISYHCEDYDTKTFSSQIEQVIGKIEKISKSIENYDGEILNFDSKKEIENLSLISGTINRIFSHNGATFDVIGSNGFLTLKWDSSFNLIGAEYEDESAENKISVTRSLHEYKGKRQIESQRTQFIIFSLYKIVSEGLDKEWSDFMEDYIGFDDVQIVSRKETIERDSFIEEKEAGDVKTLNEYNKETNFYLNPDRKKEKLNQRKLQFDFSGASILDVQNIESLKSNIDLDSKQAYNKFLNNVDFRKIVIDSVKSLIPERINQQTSDILDEARKIESDIDKYKTRLEEGVKTGRKIKDELKNIVEDGKNYLRNGGDYLPKLERDLQKIESRTEELIYGTSDNQEIQTGDLNFYKNNIKNITEPTFENESVISTLKNIVSPDQQDMDLEDLSYSISQDAIDLLANNTGMDDGTFGIIKENAKRIAGKKNLDFKKVTHFPQIKYNDSLPTDDISEMFFKELLNATSSAINETIKMLINTALEAAFSSNKSSGGTNLNGNYPSDFSSQNNVSLDKSASKPLIENMFGEKIKPDAIQEVLDDVGNLLSPKEFCALMEGEPSEESLRIIRATMQATNPELNLDTISKIRYFFSMLSSYSNYEDCNNVLSEVPEYLTDDFLCPPNSTLREAILKNKGMTDAQIKSQLEKERQRSKKQAEKLLDHLKDGLLSGDSEAPNDFCGKDENGKSVPGNSSFMDDNFRYTLSSTVAKTFEPIYNSFRDDSGTFIDSLFSNANGKRKPLPRLLDAYRSNKTVKYSLGHRRIDLNFPETEKNITLSETGDQGSLDDLMSILNSVNEEIESLSIIESLQGDSIRFTINTSGGLLFVEKRITDSHKNFLQLSDEDTASTLKFMEQILVKSYEENTSVTSQTLQTVRNQAGAIQNNLRTRMFSKIFETIAKSPYLENIGNISEEDDKPSEPDYILDYINLCPPPTPSCDPHILGVRSEVDKIYNEFKNDMCADPATGTENPKKTPLEGSLMSSCIKLILRHYIVETMAKGILSLSSTQGKNNLDDLTLSHIFSKLRKSMKSYGEQYYKDFISEVKGVYQGLETAEAKIVKDMINQEYQGISDTLFEVLFLKNKTIDLKSDIMNSTPIVELESPDITGLSVVEELSETPSPFIIVRQQIAQITHVKLCLAVGTNIVEVNTGDDFYKLVNLGEGLKSVYLIPIASKDFVNPPRDKEILEYFIQEGRANIVLDMCLPVDILSSLIFIYEIESLSRIAEVETSYGNTRDNLFSIFYSIMPMKDDWKKESKSLSDIATMTGMSGGAGLTSLWDFNFGVFDTPVTENTFNYGLPVSWGNSFKGLFFSFAQKAIKDAALKTLKDSIESSDPNIIYSKKISEYAKLAGQNISTTKISALASLINPLLYPQTPGSLTYHALGLGSYTSSKISTNNISQEKANKIENAGLRLPEFCEEILLD